ncbi:hypothetical protein HDV05_003649 [Chytridiales sp. JEL 0842]|nr:hypothetical protein HDV05_003649 [Chytridiales sp. JEL 0842]
MLPIEIYLPLRTHALTTSYHLRKSANFDASTGLKIKLSTKPKQLSNNRLVVFCFNLFEDLERRKHEHQKGEKKEHGRSTLSVLETEEFNIYILSATIEAEKRWKEETLMNEKAGDVEVGSVITPKGVSVESTLEGFLESEDMVDESEEVEEEKKEEGTAFDKLLEALDRQYEYQQELILNSSATPSASLDRLQALKKEHEDRRDSGLGQLDDDFFDLTKLAETAFAFEWDLKPLPEIPVERQEDKEVSGRPVIPVRRHAPLDPATLARFARGRGRTPTPLSPNTTSSFLAVRVPTTPSTASMSVQAPNSPGTPTTASSITPPTSTTLPVNMKTASLLSYLVDQSALVALIIDTNKDCLDDNPSTVSDAFLKTASEIDVALLEIIRRLKDEITYGSSSSKNSKKLIDSYFYNQLEGLTKRVYMAQMEWIEFHTSLREGMEWTKDLKAGTYKKWYAVAGSVKGVVGFVEQF